PKRVLLLRQDRIGDVLVSIAFIKKLKNLLPNTKIDIVLSHRNKSAFFTIKDYVSNSFVLEKGIFSYFKLLNKIRSTEYDIIIDLLDNASSTSTILTEFAKAKLKLGFDKENRKVYTHIVELPNKNENHIIERLNSLLLPIAGNVSNEETLSFSLSDESLCKANELIWSKSNKIRLGINLSGSDNSKNWGTGNYIGFLKILEPLKSELEVKVFTTKSNEKQLNQITEVKPNVAAPFVNSFEQFTAMISTCDIVLTPDTSVVHLCTAFDIPCIALYTYSDKPNVGMPWEPKSKYSKVIKISEKETLSFIKVTDVLAALKQTIEEIND
ncbi:MAG: glycosyltransferase family 9 protein, partial [Candidatus Kapaibacterium sp.]